MLLKCSAAVPCALSLALLVSSAHAQQGAPVLTPLGRTDLPGYSGDFDHFAADVQTDRLYLAAEDHGTLESSAPASI